MLRGHTDVILKAIEFLYVALQYLQCWLKSGCLCRYHSYGTRKKLFEDEKQMSAVKNPSSPRGTEASKHKKFTNAAVSEKVNSLLSLVLPLEQKMLGHHKM